MIYENLKIELLGDTYKKNPIFSSKILNTKLPVIGLYSKDLKSVIKKYENIDLSTFVLNEFYETNFIFIYINLKHLKTLDKQLDFLFKYSFLIDTWALTDSTYQLLEVKAFDEELKYINTFLNSENEFLIRYGYLLLFNYKKELDLEKVLPLFKDSKYFYVQMVEAWCLAEFYIYYPNEIYRFLKESKLDLNIKLKAISKAIDSFRISSENKENIRFLRRFLKK